MKHKTLVATFCSLLIGTITATPVLGEEQLPYQSGVVLYKLSDKTTPRELKGFNALLSAQGLVSSPVTKGSKLRIARMGDTGREKAVAKILEKSGYVEFAHPDYLLAPDRQPDDPSFSSQWHHMNINSRQAWDITTGANTVLVAVCDTGFDVNHPDLAANMRTDLAYNAQDGSDYIFDANGHGTGTAGTLGAVGNNATGVAGVNWHVDIIPVRIAISDTNSSAYISTMATCIEYAANQGARVVNLSYGGIQFAAIDSAAQYLRSQGGLLFMSAGNAGQEFADYPDYSSFIGVGATNPNNERASFSSYGNYVDITAPGTNIRTTYPDNRYVNYSGTSFSSPVAAGVAALMVAANPSITVDELEAGLFSTAVDIGSPGDDNVYGHGLVDAASAVNYAINLGSSTPPVAQINASELSMPFGSTVTFDASSSYDPDGTILSYNWELGDGTVSTQPSIQHTYPSSGSYRVRLTVTDNDGLSHTASETIQVTTALPNAVISDPGSLFAVGDTVLFDGSQSNDPDGTIVSYQWNFGDGNVASGEQVGHSYTSAGLYPVTLTVTDDAGAINTSTVEVQVNDPFAVIAPDGLTAEANGPNVLLTWNDTNSNESSISVERGKKIRGKIRYDVVAVLAANSVEYIDQALAPAEYYYRVVASNGVNSAMSSVVNVSVTDEMPTVPGDIASPVNLVADLSGQQVYLSWVDNSDGELGFYIERGIKVKGKVMFARIAIVAANNPQYVDNLSGSSSGNYVYRVFAYNDSGASAASNTASVRLN